MARNLWRPRRFALPSPVVGTAIIALPLILLIVLIIGLRNGCQRAPEQEKPEPATVEVETLKAPTPEPSPPEPKDTEDQSANIFEAHWDAGRRAFDQGHYLDARDQLIKALSGITDQSKRKMIQVQLSTIAKELTFSRHIEPGDTTVEFYHVKSGEFPSTIAKQFSITAELFMKINNIPNPVSMRADKDYKVIKGPFDAVVHKKTFRLDVFLGDYYIKTYEIGLGRDNSTPTGTFLAGSKLKKPSWRAPADNTGRRPLVLHGDPRNPLGKRWISLRQLPDRGGKETDYGIHGTNEPQTIGTQASHGCIRMRNGDVIELFDLLVSGKSRITIMAD